MARTRCTISAVAGVILLLVFASAATAAPPAQRGWKPSLARLNRCVDHLPQEFQPALKQLTSDLNTGLSGGFLKQSQRKPQMPPSYVDSLDGDAELCEFALARSSRADVTPAINDLRLDLQTKVQDCREHGWYRNVKVVVQTLRGGKADPGWEIFYLWIPGRNFSSIQPVRFKALSPSEESLPPGLYVFRARRNNVQSEEARVAVVSKDSVLCQLIVP